MSGMDGEMDKWIVYTTDHPSGYIPIVQADYFVLDTENKCVHFYRRKLEVLIRGDQDYVIAYFTNVICVFIVDN